ncbi:MAG: LamG-like jellyroll fold domain-containing protein [Tepidisphaerales bacterium]
MALLVLLVTDAASGGRPEAEASRMGRSSAASSAAAAGPALQDAVFRFDLRSTVSSDRLEVADSTGSVTARAQRPVTLGELGPSWGMVFDGSDQWLMLDDDHRRLGAVLPKRAFTVMAWVNVQVPQEWGAFFSAMQDDGGTEYGLLLGYRKDRFAVAVSTAGSDDGDGLMTYLVSPAPFEPGRWYHVAGTYDGATLRLYVNGRPVAETARQSGDVIYPPTPHPVAMGCYLDRNECYPLAGAIRELSMHHRALSGDEVKSVFEPLAALSMWNPLPPPAETFVVQPFLAMPTQEGITIAFESPRPARAVVEYGLRLPMMQRVEVAEPRAVQHVTLAGLSPATHYFYRVSTYDGESLLCRSPVLTFQTAVRDDDAFAFTVVGDTQNNPVVVSRINEHAYALRPHFQLHVGDIVGDGRKKHEWTEEFFRPSHGLMGRVPVFPVLGNHDEDASWFYDYFPLPQPKYAYTFRFGNAQFFAIDTNRSVEEGSEQWQWLDRELGSSQATWKIVYHHHPVYSSDENDHGDTYRGPSTWGKPEHQRLARLYERHKVDLVFVGHIHLYERSHPVRDGRFDPQGVRYITTGGSGGGLEAFAPSRTWFFAHGRITHHFCYVVVQGRQLTLQAYDLENRLFDSMTVNK